MAVISFRHALPVPSWRRHTCFLIKQLLLIKKQVNILYTCLNIGRFTNSPLLVNIICLQAKIDIISGSYLKVRDKNWSSALEHIIGNSMKTFCVNNEQDSRNLFNIMQKVYGNESKPTITTSRFYDRVHDVSKKSVRAPTGTNASLSCLQIDDPIVANFLIDNIGMESILLVQTHGNI